MRRFAPIKAVLLAAIIFAALHYFLTVITNKLSVGSANFPEMLPWLNVTAYALYLLAGAVAAIVSGKHFVPVGLVAGFASALVAVLLFRVGGDAVGIVVTLASGLGLGALGGFASMVLIRRNPNAL